MKRRNLIVAAGLAAALLGVAACGSSSDDSGDNSAASDPKSITVWLQTDAHTGWPSAVEMRRRTKDP